MLQTSFACNRPPVGYPLPLPRRSKCTLFKLHYALFPSSSSEPSGLLYWSLVMGTGSLNRPTTIWSNILNTPRPCISGSVHRLSGIPWSRTSVPIPLPLLSPNSFFICPNLDDSDHTERLCSLTWTPRKPLSCGMMTGKKSSLLTAEQQM